MGGANWRVLCVLSLGAIPLPVPASNPGLNPPYPVSAMDHFIPTLITIISMIKAIDTIHTYIFVDYI